MQAINSTVEILLLGNKQAAINSIAHLLNTVKFPQCRLLPIPDLGNLIARIPSNNPQLIFYILDQQQEQKLLELEQLNTQNIPIILVSTIAEFDLASLPIDIDDYLLYSEITAASLSKTIFLALRRHQNELEAETISQENIELSSQLLGTKNLFQTIIDNTSTLVWMCDADGQSIYFNQAWSRLFGQKIDPKLNPSWMLKIHPDDLAKCQQEFSQALAEARGFTMTYRLQYLAEEYLWIYNTALPQFEFSGEFKGLLGYCFDITSLKQTEQQLIHQASCNHLLAQITQKIHASLDLDQILQTTVQEVNQFLQAEKIQINRFDLHHKLTFLFESRLSRAELSCEINQNQRFPVVLFHNNIAQLAAGKIVTHNELNLSQITAEASSVLLIPIISEQHLWGLISVEQYSLSREWTIEEIRLLEQVAMELSVAVKQAQLYQELGAANLELAKLSVVDDLTKIANRRKFDQYLAAEWSRLAREQNLLSLILCDVDYFKLYNDTYGHPAGDRCLRQVAQAISDVVKRPADLVARYGGEEFAIILPNTPLAGAIHLAQQIKLQIQALKLPHINSPIDLYVTLSLGVACCLPQPDGNFETLVAAADRGLYQAKATGRNRVVQYQMAISSQPQAY
ncbi:MAG: diguanylate cyclase [Cyanobacteria bacterium J06621_8]